MRWFLTFNLSAAFFAVFAADKYGLSRNVRRLTSGGGSRCWSNWTSTETPTSSSSRRWSARGGWSVLLPTPYTLHMTPHARDTYPESYTTEYAPTYTLHSIRHLTPCTLHTTHNTQHTTHNTQHTTHNTQHPSPYTVDQPPLTPDTTTSTLNPELGILNPTHQAVTPKPSTLHLQPSTINPKPPTPNPHL